MIQITETRNIYGIHNRDISFVVDEMITDPDVRTDWMMKPYKALYNMLSDDHKFLREQLEKYKLLKKLRDLGL